MVQTYKIYNTSYKIKHTKALCTLYLIRHVRDTVVRTAGRVTRDMTLMCRSFRAPEVLLSLLANFPDVNLDYMLIGVCRNNCPKVSMIHYLLERGANPRALYLSPLRNVISGNSPAACFLLLQKATCTSEELNFLIGCTPKKATQIRGMLYKEVFYQNTK